jgi:hypothetical protein
MLKARWLLVLNIVALVSVALAFRVIQLGQLPGVNGDEAWYGVQASRLLEGKPFARATGSGNPLNPFFTGMDAALLLFFRPTFTLLRIPALICGVLTVALAYVLGRRVLDRTTAAIAAIVLAVLPIMIGYSRFGWDASQTPLFSLLALLCALRGWGIGLAVLFVPLLLVHPTNVFLLPIVLMPWAVVLLRCWRECPGSRWRIAAGSLASAAILVGAIVRLVPMSRRSGSVLARLTDLGQWQVFLTHVGRLFSGVSLYKYIVQPDLSDAVSRLHDGAFWLLAATVSLAGGYRLARGRHWERLALCAGFGLGVLVLDLVAGPGAIAPSIERYGMFLVVPGAFAFACLVGRPGHEGSCDAVRLALVSIGGWAVLLSFQAQYFGRMSSQVSHPAFRTSRVEPKQRALSLILRDLARNPQRRPGQAPVRVITEDWWLYWPIAFLATSRGAVEVSWLESPSLPEPRINSAEGEAEAQRRHLIAELRGGAYAVGFAEGRADSFPGGRLDQLVRSSFAPGEVRRWTIPDRSGRAILTVVRLEAPAAAIAGQASTARRR